MTFFLHCFNLDDPNSSGSLLQTHYYAGNNAILVNRMAGKTYVRSIVDWTLVKIFHLLYPFQQSMAPGQIDLISDGREALNRTVCSLEELSHVYKYMVDWQYTPLDCTAIQKVAIIVPYRDREKTVKDIYEQRDTKNL